MIAKQHNCPLIDMIPKEHPTSPTVHVNVCFDPHLSEFLFLSSWKDFDMLCSDIKVQSVRHQIGSILKKLHPMTWRSPMMTKMHCITCLFP